MTSLNKSFLREKLLITSKGLLVLLKWLVMGALIGLIVGAISSAFSFCLSYVTTLRMEHSWLVYLLPIGGLLIVGLYRIVLKDVDIGTDEIITAISEKPHVRAMIAPLIFISTTITHLCGGSAGREGAALQLGGSLGNFLGRIIRMSEQDRKILITAGMSAAFSAMFGTPMAAAIFSVEAAMVGSIYLSSLLPSVIAAVVASQFSASLGISPESFVISVIPDFTLVSGLKIILLAILVGGLSIVFCVTMKYVKIGMKKWIRNPFIRVLVASGVFILITTFVGNGDFYGAGIHIVEKAVHEGTAKWYYFVMKIILTAIIMGAGFKGGEIVPAFYVGATFGCIFGKILGVSPGLCAAMGMTAMFCGITNCPIASMLISFELFGFNCVPYIIIVVAVSFVASGYSGIYTSQKFLYSKYRPIYKNKNGGKQ